MTARGVAAAALALAGLALLPIRAGAQCVGVDDCLDHYTDSYEWWTKKDKFTYLVAARATD